MACVHELTDELIVPRPLDEVFAFFADAENLEAITPPWLRFEITSPRPISMGTGTLIDYRLRLHGVPIRWRTRIRVWEPPFLFVDEQLRGPYRRWVHEHTFERHPEGTRVRDRVEYSHLGGPLVHRWLVGPDLDRVFAYRKQRLTELLAPAGACGALTDRAS